MTRIFSDFVSSYPDTPIFRTAMALVRNGYAIVPVTPGGKAPLCTLPSRERSKDPSHACGVYHFITEAKVAERVFKRLAKEYGQEANIGIVAHPSRVVVIDADVPDAVNAFRSRWAQAEEDEGFLTRSPTVSTPGSRRGDEWRHHDGGHWYFDVPEGLILPVSPGQLILPGGADVRWGMLMTVAPPSVRAEGAYIVHGDMPTLPAWIVHEIRSHTERRASRQADLTTRFLNDDVVQWSIRTEWAELLVPCGWTDVNKLDRCGCPIWEKPGGGSTGPKSATAHEGICTVGENREGHGMLHLWTTDPPVELAGRSNVTKLQFYALMHHGGDEAAAEVELGLVPDYEKLWDTSGQPVSDPAGNADENLAGRPNDPPQAADQAEQPAEQPAAGPTDEVAADKHRLSLAARRVADVTGMSYADAHGIVGDVWARREAKTAVDAYFGPETFDGSSWLPRGQEEMLRSVRRDRTEKAEGVLERTDGATLFPLGKLHELFGQSSAGKTFLMMIVMWQQVVAGHRCLYVDFEDTLDTFIDRYIIDLGIDIVPFIEAGLLCYANPIEPPGDLTPLIDLDFKLVVVDSLSEVVSATADGSLKDGVLIKRIFGNFRKMAVAGASVVIIAHGSEKVDVPGTSLGASEIRQSLTGQDVLLQEKRPFDSKTPGHSLIYIAKDRGSHAGGDTDMNERASNKVTRRLWGAMVVEPTPPDGVFTTTWHTEIKIEKMLHVETEPPKVSAIDVAEQLIITYLRDRPEPKREEGTTDEQFELLRQTARQADMTDDLVDEENQKERTVRRAVKKLIEDGMIHVVAQEASPTGGTPSPILKLGPAPEKPTETKPDDPPHDPPTEESTP